MAAIVITVVTIAVILALNREKEQVPKLIAIGIVGLEIVGTVMSFSVGSGNLKLQKIKRPESSSEQREVTVEQGKKKEKVTVSITARKLTDEEARKAVESAKKLIRKEYLGKNKDASHVYRNLKLRDKYNGRVQADWEMTPFDIFDSEGKIDNSKAEKKTEVSIKGHLDCQGKTGTIELDVTAIPIPTNTPEGFAYYLNKAIADANSKDPTSEYVTLPKTLDGKSITFSEKKEDDGIKLVIMMALSLGLYVFYTKQKAKDDEKKWQRELSLDYPKMISQLSLYIGAGFSVKAAFAQVGNAYVRGRARGHPQRPAFEEVVRMNRKIKDGEDEESAYKDLGESLRHRGFRKLTLLLAQSLRKGGKDLRDQLEQEEHSAYDERKIEAKVAGEEASLKLLIPMMGLLAVIFIVLMVPAFMQMS